MSKISDIVSDLNRAELADLIKAAKKEISARPGFTIKQLLKKCGKKECMCSYDPDGWHGPYVTVLYANKTTGKQEQKSLGRVLIAEDFQAMREEEAPNWYEYRISPRRLKAVPKAQHHIRGWYEYELKPNDFLNYYGVSMSEDNLQRPKRIIIEFNKYDKDYKKWEENQIVGGSKWQFEGVGTLKGVRILDGLEQEGYYFRM